MFRHLQKFEVCLRVGWLCCLLCILVVHYLYEIVTSLLCSTFRFGGPCIVRYLLSVP